MITLITGTPGSGKTAWVLQELLALRKVEPDRELYIHGVRNLRGIAHETIYCKSQLCDICRGQVVPADALYVENWPEWKKSGSLIVVDEVQRIWRPRTGGSLMPVGVSGLETHRHYGVDFWLISQGSHLFDIAIRLLVGRHIHLLGTWAGRTQYEWPECKQDTASTVGAVERPYKLPKQVFSLYDSAEVHTKLEKRKPLSFYAMIISVIVAAGLIYYTYARLQAHIMPEPSATSSPGGGAALAATTTTTQTDKIQPLPDFKPEVQDLAESAPAYRHLLKVTAVPLLAGCVLNSSTGVCKCFTAQATPYQASDEYCRAQIENKRFNPYLVGTKQEKPQTLATIENKPELNPAKPL